MTKTEKKYTCFMRNRIIKKNLLANIHMLKSADWYTDEFAEL